jgi:hypothetical protein
VLSVKDEKEIAMRYAKIFIFFLFSILYLNASILIEESNLTRILTGNIKIASMFSDKSSAQIIRQKATEEINLREKQNIPFNNIEKWQIKVLSNDPNFSDENFLNLSIKDQKAVYQTANNLCNVPFVERIKNLNPALEPISETVLNGNVVIQPSITSQFMDVVTIKNIIFHHLKEFRSSNQLFKEDEIPNKISFDNNWIKKKGNSFGRILGSSYLELLINNLQLKHIKVPKKILIINLEKNEKKSVTINPLAQRMITIHIPHSYIYVEKITGLLKPDGKRKFTQEEIQELFTILEASQYSDLNVENFIVTDNAIYFIDTEFIPGFDNILEWNKLIRFFGYIAKEDEQFFSDLLNDKLKQKEIYPDSYKNMKFLYNYIKENNPEELKTQNYQEIKQFLEYCELVGSHHNRTIDNFPFGEIFKKEAFVKKTALTKIKSEEIKKITVKTTSFPEQVRKIEGIQIEESTAPPSRLGKMLKISLGIGAIGLLSYLLYQYRRKKK